MNDAWILSGKMLQWYIHVLAEYFCMRLERHNITGVIARNTNPNGDAKKHQHLLRRVS
jgi:hypothetical protein